LAAFQVIPPFTIKRIVEDDNGKNRYEYAQVVFLLGVGAYYTDDIGGASKYLVESLSIFGSDEPPDQYLLARAFCSHFLGILHKNWRDEKIAFETNLLAAQRHFQDAAERLKGRSGDFLTPITLAETLTYAEHTLDAACVAIEDIVRRLGQTKDLNENQSTLYGRAFLIRGNIDFMRGKTSGAHAFYDQSFIKTASVFAKLSMAQTVEDNLSKRLDMFREGLGKLEASAGPLNRREASGRMTARAWALIAAREIGDGEKQAHYERLLRDSSSEARHAAGREPLFFCPATKALVGFEKLLENALRD